MRGRTIVYSDAEMAWLEAYRLLPISEYQRAFCAAFGREVAVVNLHALRKRKGWKTGRTGCFVKGAAPVNKGKQCAPGTGGLHPNARKTQFKPGNLPHNTNYLGHERLSKNGYIEISVDEVNPHTGFERRYVLKHRHLWELANGPVPEGMALKCRGDRLNTDPANWELIPRALLPRLNGGRNRRYVPYDEAPDALKPSIMAIAKVAHEISEKRRAA